MNQTLHHLNTVMPSPSATRSPSRIPSYVTGYGDRILTHKGYTCNDYESNSPSPYTVTIADTHVTDTLTDTLTLPNTLTGYRYHRIPYPISLPSDTYTVGSEYYWIPSPDAHTSPSDEPSPYTVGSEYYWIPSPIPIPWVVDTIGYIHAIPQISPRITSRSPIPSCLPYTVDTINPI